MRYWSFSRPPPTSRCERALRSICTLRSRIESTPDASLIEYDKALTESLEIGHMSRLDWRSGGSQTLDGVCRVGFAQTIRLLRITSEYQRLLSFGVRRWVPNATCTMPKRFSYPSAHSKLSSSDQRK